MNDVAPNQSASLAVALMTYYGSEGTRLSTRVKLLAKWFRSYPEPWVRLALIESLYQGRYKTVCVEQLLELWQRRGQPVCHFNAEFAALVCKNIPRELAHFPDEKRDHGFSRKSPTRYRPEITAHESSINEHQTEQLEVNRNDITSSATNTNVVGQISFEQPEVEEINSFSPEQAEARVPTIESIDISEASTEDLLELDESALFQLKNLGIDPIHPFVLEDEVDEFCEKLVAMAVHRG